MIKMHQGIYSFLLKLVSKNPTNTSSISYKTTVLSSISKSKTNPSMNHLHHRHSSPHFYSHDYTTATTICSYSSWRLLQKYVPGKKFGSLSNPVLLVEQLVLPNALLKSPTRCLADCRLGLGFLRASQFPRPSFHPNPSFGSYARRWQSWFRRLTTNGVVLGLIITNAAVFMLWQIADRKFMTEHFMISLDNIRSGRVHTIITSAFSHHQLGHLIYNMIGLYFFGMNIGRVFGPYFLLKLYLSGATLGSVFYLVHHAFMARSSKGKQMWIDPSTTPGLGASGAVNAIMLLDIFLFPKNTIYLEFIIPVPAILLGIFLIGQDMLRIIQGDEQISGSVHLGGAVVAAIAWARIRRGRF